MSASAQFQEIPIVSPSLTSSKVGTFYFAYGSNLSPYQMRLRLLSKPTDAKSYTCPQSESFSPSTANPHIDSATPIAIVRLDNCKWIICERGYANVVPLNSPLETQPSLVDSTSHRQSPNHHARTPDQDDHGNGANSPHKEDEDEYEEQDANTVWGVLYNLFSDSDVTTLDLYEGHDSPRNPNPTPNPDSRTRHIMPYEQGNWDYNKFYLPVSVTRWLVDPTQFGLPPTATLPPLPPASIQSPSPASPDTATAATAESKDRTQEEIIVRTLIYIDTYRTSPGRINREYIGRMNRAISESVELGLPERWVENVMREYVPPGIEVEREGYVGTDKGYLETETSESYDEVMERKVKEWREGLANRKGTRRRGGMKS